MPDNNSDIDALCTAINNCIPINWEYELGFMNCHVQDFDEFWQRSHPVLGMCFLGLEPH